MRKSSQNDPLKKPVRAQSKRLSASAATVALTEVQPSAPLTKETIEFVSYDVDFPTRPWKEPGWTAEFATPEGRERLLDRWAEMGIVPS